MRSNKEVTEIIDRITKIAEQYKNNMIGKTFLILFEGESVEVVFKAENFLHLCGVDTVLYAKDFYRKAVHGQLKESEIGFSSLHPYHFADIKTKHLSEALSIMNRESLVITDVVTKTRGYKLGTTDLEIVFCFDSQLNINGKPIGETLIPYSLRIEDISNNNFDEMYEVDYVLSKKTGTKEYNTVEFGNKELLKDYLKDNGIDKYLINIPCEQSLSHKNLLDKAKECIADMKEQILMGSAGNMATPGKIPESKDNTQKPGTDNPEGSDMTDDTDPKADGN